MSYMPLDETSRPITPAINEGRADKLSVETDFKNVTCPDDTLLEPPFKKFDDELKAAKNKRDSEQFDKLFAAAPSVIAASIAGTTGVNVLNLEDYRARK